MRFTLYIALLAAATVASAQTGLQGQSANNAEMNKAIDRAAVALANALRVANTGDLQSTKDALNIANVRWAELYSLYKSWPTSDTAWKSNFESINTALLNAVNALTPGNNLPGAKTQINSAVTTLASLRSRNGIPDIRTSAASLDTSLKALETSITALQGRPLTPADIDNLQKSFGSFRDNWTLFSQDVIDVNALGLGEGKLDDLARFIALQNVALDSINNVLKNPDTRTLLTQWQSVRSQIQDLLTNLNSDIQNSQTAEEAAAATQGAEDPSADAKSGDHANGRPRLFPRLRRQN